MQVQLADKKGLQAQPVVAADRLTVSLFGAFAVRHGGRSLQIKSKKAQGLLGYLLLNASLRESRERLSGLFWSESTEEKARASLRQTLHQLREIFEEIGCDGLMLGRDDVSVEKTI